MRIKTLLGLLLMLAAIGLTSCAESTSTSGGGSDTANDGGDPGGDGGGDGATGGGGSSSGSGSGSDGPTCFGNSNDGEGDGYALYSYTILVAGQGEGDSYQPDITWRPWGNGDNVSSLGQNLLPKINEAAQFFQSDSKLNVRFKLRPQPNPPAGEEYCYGRVTGKAGDANDYSKVRFKVSLRDVTCQQGGDPNDCELGNRYQTQSVGPVSVDSCSPILQLGHLRNTSGQGTVVEVWDVRTDQTCEFNDSDCPADDLLRASSCWEATMQFATDYTQSFKK